MVKNANWGANGVLQLAQKLNKIWDMEELHMWPAWISDFIWLIEVGIFLVLVFWFNFFLKRALARFKRHARLKENDWKIHLDYVLVDPVRILLWIFFAVFFLDITARQFKVQDMIPSIPLLRNISIVFCLSWFLLRWKKVFVEALIRQRARGKIAMEPYSIQIVGKIFSVAVVFVGSLIVLQIFGLNIMPLIAFGGIGAAAIGIASKDVVANFFGGLMIHLTRPFIVNELIELPGKQIVGYIEEIGWYFTSIRNLDKKPIYIPNSIFSTEVLVNQSRMSHRHIEEKIPICLHDIDKAPQLIDQIREYLVKQPDIDQNQLIYVYASTLNENAIELIVRAYTLRTKEEEFIRIKQAILLKVCEFLKAAGVEFPTTEITLRKS